jgi:hypothetical protein
MKQLIFILASMVCLTSAAFPCSMVGGIERPLNEANVRAYIFVGEVVGYTDVVKLGDKRSGEGQYYSEGRGVRIKPVEAINLPKVPRDYFELYKFGVTTWCADRLADLSYLKIGTKLRIVAGEATLLPGKADGNRIRIESKIFDRFSIVEDDEPAATEHAEFDYKNNWRLLLDKYRAAKEYEKIESFDDLIYLETTKDLLRLKNAASKKQRYRILERLLYNPKVDFPALVSPALGQHTVLLRLSVNPAKEKPVKLTRTEKALLERRKELETSGYFK